MRYTFTNGLNTFFKKCSVIVKRNRREGRCPKVLFGVPQPKLFGDTPTTPRTTTKSGMNTL